MNGQASHEPAPFIQAVSAAGMRQNMLFQGRPCRARQAAMVRLYRTGPCSSAWIQIDPCLKDRVRWDADRISRMQVTVESPSAPRQAWCTCTQPSL